MAGRGNLLNENRVFEQIHKEWTGMSKIPFDEKEGMRLTGVILDRCSALNRLSMTDEELSDLAYTLLDRMMYYPVTNMELFLTENCNLRCDYCFVKRKNHHQRMSLETGLKAIDFLFDYSYNQKDLHLIFFGGEPILEYKNIRKYIEYSEKKASETGKRISFALTSNALLLDEEKINYLNSHNLLVLLSIDGIEQVHDKHRVTADGRGSFRGIMEKIPMLKRTQGWLGARMTVLPDSVDFLFDGVHTLFQAGINQFIIGIANDGNWSDERIDSFRNQLFRVAQFAERMVKTGKAIRVSILEHDVNEADVEPENISWGCYAGKTSVAVSTDGYLYPCSRFDAITEHDPDSPFVLGHLDTGFKGNPNREIFIDIEETLKKRCGSCSIKASCHGGCPAVNYELTGDLAGAPPSECELHMVVEDVFMEYGEYMNVYSYEQDDVAEEIA